MQAWLPRYLSLRNYFTDEFLGGPRIKFAWVINLQKGGTLPFVLAMMWWYGYWTMTAWVCMAAMG